MKFVKIHEDMRGEIALVLDVLPDGREVTIFTTKKGYARGGCIHRESDEDCAVIVGEIEYWIGSEKPVILVRGDACCIKANTPHYFTALTDTVVMEWGALPWEKKEKYPPSRKLVDNINLNRVNELIT